MIRKLGFCDLWVNRVMKCVTTVRYNLVLSGKRIASFNPERGLRQGDPLSPYLADVLSSMVTDVVYKKNMVGLRLVRNCPMVSH